MGSGVMARLEVGVRIHRLLSPRLIGTSPPRCRLRLRPARRLRVQAGGRLLRPHEQL